MQKESKQERSRNLKHLVRRSILGEFFSFLSEKSVLPLAIGIVIADSVKQLVNVIVDGAIRPLIGLFIPSNTEFAPLNISFRGVVFRLGDIFTAVLQTFIIFMILYVIVGKVLKKKELILSSKK